MIGIGSLHVDNEASYSSEVCFVEGGIYIYVENVRLRGNNPPRTVESQNGWDLFKALVRELG